MPHITPRLYWTLAILHLVLVVGFHVYHLWHSRPQ